MGLFDIFSKKKTTSPPPPAEPKVDRNISRLARVVGDKLAQNYDRFEAIQALSKIQSPEAATALLRRFTFYVEPSITDQEEKELAFQAIVDCRDQALEPVLSFCEKAESLTWPLKILREILAPESYIAEVVGLLEDFDTDYTRNNDPKIQLIAALENDRSDEARAATVRFLDDVSEPVRFQAVLTLFSIGNPECCARLAEIAIEEESQRVRNKIAEGLALQAWPIPPPLRDRFSAAVAFQSGFSLDAEGRLVGRPSFLTLPSLLVPRARRVRSPPTPSRRPPQRTCPPPRASRALAA